MSLSRPGYNPRLIDEQIKRYLNIFGAICIEGPKWCGKTWTALNHSNSVTFLASPENNFQNRTMAQLDPNLVLPGEPPRLLDEWQEVPALLDSVRHSVDETGNKGRYILTGSATPQSKGIIHSGTGRIAKIRMRPMSLFESSESTGKISLQSLFSHGLENQKATDVPLETLMKITLRGGWPGSIGLSTEDACELPKSYIRNIIDEDIRDIDGINRNRHKFEMLLHSLARNEITLASNKTLMKDMLEESNETINPNTFSDYMDVLRRLFIIEEQPAFSPNLRSSVRVGKSSKRQFTDPSLAAAILGATNKKLFSDLNTFGLLFESLCIRDLRIYSEAIEAKLYHYRDEKGREIDAVIELSDGKWGAFEIKLGANQIDKAAEKLIRISKLMASDKKSVTPEILCVICGISGYAYTREDGVMVVPITELKP